MQFVEYKLPVYGLGTDFSEFERPITFATTYTNRFRNITGGAERRPGAQIFLTQVTALPTLTRMHEHVSNTGTTTLLASDDFGNIWRYNASGNPTLAYTSPADLRLISAQAEDKLIFVNGEDRNFYTDDGGQTFNELKALITRGTLAGSSNTTTIIDGDISNWATGTLVANNDIVFNITRQRWGIVTAIGSALTITPISTSGNGAGLSLLGDQAPGDSYEVVDYVDLNVIEQPSGLMDNIAVTGPGTSNTQVFVSGVDFSTTEMRSGDFVYNTTQGAISMITSVSAGFSVNLQIIGQAAGDSIALFKSAMPIASNLHVHYGRTYFLDSRDKTRIVITAPDDPQDVTTYQKTLNTTSYSFGNQQPTGDVILSMGTFQKYFVASGEKNLYIYEGITPIADTSSTTVDFRPIAFYPNGIATRFGIATNGSDLLHETKEGLQAINIGNISNTTVQNNASVPVRTAMLDAIAATTNTDNIQLSFYPRRSWLINKISDVCYVLNTNPTYDDAGNLQIIASWHLFTGLWAQLNHYFVRRNGDLIGCGPQGKVYKLDASAATDDGQPIATDLATAWLTLEEPRRTPRIKQGQYIMPVFESPNGIGYTINAVAGWDNFSSDSIVVSAVGAGQIGSAIVGTTPIGAGNFAQANKYPLRWRGEQVRIQITSNSSAAQDIVTGFTLFGTIGGIR